jgi:CBS domain-containing protein
LTEKIARRGYHVSREYTVDPLEMLSVGEVMTAPVVTIPASLPIRELLRDYFQTGSPRKHQGYPVVDGNGNLQGVVTRRNLLEDWLTTSTRSGTWLGPPTLEPVIIVYDLIQQEPITCYPWESCRTAAERMAQEGVGRLPVVAPDDPKKVIGMITRSDLLKPRARQVEDEMRRERLIDIRGASSALQAREETV